VVSLETPDRDGRPGEIGMGFDNLAGYTESRHYCGALVGRVANRIRDGKFTLDGKQYQLWTDARGIHLHGGKDGYSFKLWDAAEEDGKLRLDYFSPDGDENYPGNLKVTVWYWIEDMDLKIEYRAETDQTTIVNLTNHTFFNLNGFKRDILAHELKLVADSYTPVGSGLVPTGEIATVAGTPFDFNVAKPIGRDFAKLENGYDHNFVFSEGDAEWLAEVYDPDSGRTMAMATDQPCTQFYSGNFLDGSQTGIGGAVYNKFYAFCLEAQKHPDAVNHPNFSSVVLRPGETYHQLTVYRFGTR
jgi:Galactose mutarotase and related enzymes